MEIHGVLVGAILVMICVVPFIIIRINSKRKENQIVKALKVKAKEHDLEIGEIEVFADFIVGLDKDKKVLYYQALNSGNVEGTLVELSKMRSCNVQKTVRKVDVGGQITQIMEQLALEFTPREKMFKPFKLIFYNADDRLQLSGELQSIDLWGQRIANLMGK